jgi:hypothetical protein
MRGFEAAQRAYENQQPPGWDTPDYDDDCDGHDCGTCEACVTYQAEYAAELAAEAAFDRIQDRRLGLC